MNRKIFKSLFITTTTLTTLSVVVPLVINKELINSNLSNKVKAIKEKTTLSFGFKTKEVKLTHLNGTLVNKQPLLESIGNQNSILK